MGNNGRTLRVKTCQNCSFDIFQPDVPSIVFKFLEGDIIFHLPSLTCLYQPPCVGVGQYSYIFMCHDHTVILRPFWKDFSNKLFFFLHPALAPVHHIHPEVASSSCGSSCTAPSFYRSSCTAPFRRSSCTAASSGRCCETPCTDSWAS